MIVGVPKEIKTDEYRVAMIPVGAEELTRAGHRVLIQSGAGQGSGISDEQYSQNGAEIVADAAQIWQRADLVVKVKEPLPAEWPSMRAGQILFTYFHFAADEALTRAVMESGVTAVAYETIRDARGALPLLTPMSEVAGRMSIQEGAKYLERPFEGRGILLGGVPGVLPANVVVLGAGVVGAARRHQRRGRRPGRVRGNVPAGGPRTTDLHRQRGRPLLRHQQAGRGRSYQHLRADERDVALRPAAGSQGLRARPGGQPRA